MSHVTHIVKNKKNLEMRSHIIRLIREWFWSQDFLEMETPNLLRLPGQEPYLTPMKVTINNEQGANFDGYLHTSPEYTLKKMLAAGFTNMFSLCKTYRDQESFGGTHNPEFTMIEWYRANEDFWKIMEDVEALFRYLVSSALPLVGGVTRLPAHERSDGGQGGGTGDLRHVGLENMSSDERTPPNLPYKGREMLAEKFERLHMREAWQQYAGVNLDDYLERESMFGLCVEKGYKPNADEAYEDLFFRIFLNEIEPQLGKERPTIIHHYPACMAALSRLSPTDPRYAERFEVYVGGLELANCFSELTDPKEQLIRLQTEQAQRKVLGKDVYPIDMEFIEALRTMPPAAGIALGVDRLVQLFTGCKNIDDVISLPASQLFKA